MIPVFYKPFNKAPKDGRVIKASWKNRHDKGLKLKLFNICFFFGFPKDVAKVYYCKKINHWRSCKNGSTFYMDPDYFKSIG